MNDLPKDQEKIKKDLSGTTQDDWFSWERFNQMHCPYIRSKVDDLDGKDYDKPHITDSLWLASLLGHAGLVNQEPKEARRCPDIVGFAAACSGCYRRRTPVPGPQKWTRFDSGRSIADIWGLGPICLHTTSIFQIGVGPGRYTSDRKKRKTIKRKQPIKS